MIGMKIYPFWQREEKLKKKRILTICSKNNSQYFPRFPLISRTSSFFYRAFSSFPAFFDFRIWIFPPPSQIGKILAERVYYQI